ncbi:MAG: hypothetical protein CMJ38_03845 [Phycisphaerae bacterium]|nr:hypothetical protein [Phycisphaerae bacterium]
MSASKEKWMLFSTFVLVVLFVTFFIFPNYQEANSANAEAQSLEESVEQLERRQAEVEELRNELIELEAYVQDECKFVPDSPDMSSIIKSLSLDIDGYKVVDQSFTAGVAPKQQSHDNFMMQPLAVTMQSDFSSIYNIINNVETMNRFVKISSLRITRSEKEASIEAPTLDAAIGIHAMYDAMEERP